MTSYTRSVRRPVSRVSDPLADDLVAAARLRTIEYLREGLEHELRSPLNAIVLNVELLKELVRAEGGDSALVQLERLQSISESIGRLQGGLRELLRLTEEPSQARTRFDLAGLVDEVATLVGPQSRQKEVRVEVEASQGAMPIKGRREALLQALTQIVINALQASPAGARIVIATRREEGSFIVEVRDGGAGIEPEAQPRIFERHYSTRPGQTGIGLYVARRLIAADGGELALAGSGPEGTVMSAQFPEDQP